MRYAFEWNPSKAKDNLRKHGISFDRASTVFLDPSALSAFDEDHSQDEDRWVTLGLDSNGTLLTVVPTFEQVSNQLCRVRMISARRATNQEARQYPKEGR